MDKQRIITDVESIINHERDAIEYEEYNKLGTKASMGCIRLCVEDAKWIFDNCESGTKVEFCSDEDSDSRITYNQPKQISNSDEKLRGWDPTDPDTNNPWNE